MDYHLDFIYFLYGLAFLALAMMIWAAGRRLWTRLPLRWLTWFALLHGIREWLNLLALGLGDSDSFKHVRLAVLVASFLPLVEFGRRGLKAQGVRMPGGWLVPALLALGGLGALAGSSGLQAACRYALALPGGLLAGWALWREARRPGAAPGWPLRLAGLGLMAYGLAAGLIVPAAAFFPASALNQEAFLAATKLPSQLLRAACIAMVALGFWLANRQINEAAAVDGAHCGRCWAVSGLMLLLLAGGWLGVRRFGEAADKDQRAALLAQATAFARTISPEQVQALSFTAADKGKPEFQSLRAQIVAYSQAMGLQSIYSMSTQSRSVRFSAI